MNDPVTQYRITEAELAAKRECAELVFNYPGYTLEDALEMPIGDRRLLLTFARIHRSEELLENAGVLAASQSEKGYRKLTNELKNTIKQLTKQL